MKSRVFDVQTVLNFHFFKDYTESFLLLPSFTSLYLVFVKFRVLNVARVLFEFVSFAEFKLVLNFHF